MKRGSAANGVEPAVDGVESARASAERRRLVQLRRRSEPWQPWRTRAAAMRRSVPVRTAASFFRQCRILAGANMSNEMPSKGRGRQLAVKRRAGAQTELVRLAAREAT